MTVTIFIILLFLVWLVCSPANDGSPSLIRQTFDSKARKEGVSGADVASSWGVFFWLFGGILLVCLAAVFGFGDF